MKLYAKIVEGSHVSPTRRIDLATRYAALVIACIAITQIIVCKPVRYSATTHHSGKQSLNPDPVKSYRIIIKSYYFGRVQYQTILTADSLVTIHDDLNGKQTIQARSLRPDETKKMKRFLSGFPLAELGNQYINDRVEDGINVDFDIRINSEHKLIHVSNYFQDDLGELADVIRPMLKEDYIAYRKEYFSK